MLADSNLWKKKNKKGQFSFVKHFPYILNLYFMTIKKHWYSEKNSILNDSDDILLCQKFCPFVFWKTSLDHPPLWEVNRLKHQSHHDCHSPWHVMSVILIQFYLNVLLKIVVKDIGRGGRQLLPQEQQYQNTNLLLLILLLFWNYLCCKILLVVLCNNSSPKKQQYQYFLRSRKI